MSILSAIGGAFAAIGKWVGKAFKNLQTDGAKVVVSILEGYKKETANGVVPSIATIIDHVVGTHLAEDAVALLNKEVPKFLAGALLIEGVPDNPTPEQVQTFENAAYTAFTGLPATAKSKFYTTFGADVYGVVHDFANPDTPLTYAKLVEGVEAAFQDYKKDLAAEAAEKADEATNTD